MSYQAGTCILTLYFIHHNNNIILPLRNYTVLQHMYMTYVHTCTCNLISGGDQEGGNITKSTAQGQLGGYGILFKY